jgi:hypothetical protein
LLAIAVVGCGAAGETRDATWGYISPALIQPNCATGSCHNSRSAVAGLDLSTVEDGWVSLVELMVPPDSAHPMGAPRPLVVPFNPDQSRVVRMLRGDNAARMPPDRPFPLADIELIETWIRRGALFD